ncbi:hypothetical protein GNI_205540 [Gregarina niphandrodes]|uniref:Uncharacterized protein n=1 Tax=Gregarina niphandrodes TaxID=110365 RepID=A0A023AW32_GRENI|nr:hypothetical protein GNI_205540 [Gregarina niphandrodes]EZG42941.1 hypothetical protein GNI_205540 [Gregarina niphandrodes]|eukprot:XP_011133783.1 hypothetical protein GNI_205540 [Gregarina niphandrodes]
MIDRTSRWVEAAVVPDKSAHWAAATFVRRWVTRYGVPKQRHLRKHYERIRGESMRGEEESHHTTLGMTPGRWLFGVEPTIPEERELVGTLRSPNLQRIEWLAKTREETIERMQAEAQQRADRRNERRRGGHLEKGDLVLVRDPTIHERGWGFPHRVVKVSKAGHGAHGEDIVTGYREHRHAGVLRRVTAPSTNISWAGGWKSAEEEEYKSTETTYDEDWGNNLSITN